MTKDEVILLAQKVFRYEEGFFTPPEFVFCSNADHVIIIVGGGDIVDKKTNEYNNLMQVLKTIGESAYYLFIPDFAITGNQNNWIEISTASTIEDLKRALEYFFGIDFTLDSMYMFGQTGKWGLYIDDVVSINIISCEKQYAKLFIEAQQIKEDEFEKWAFEPGFEIIAKNNTDYASGQIAKSNYVKNYVNNKRNYFLQ